jgi:hypothetical protein
VGLSLGFDVIGDKLGLKEYGLGVGLSVSK